MGKEIISLDHYAIAGTNIDPNKIDRFYDQSKVASDAADPTTSSLVVGIDATRSGTIVNNRMYTGTTVEAKHRRFVTPYNKPYILDHDSHNSSSIIGRISDATFTRLEKNDDKFFNDFVYAKPNKKGSGKIDLLVNVTDAQAVAKILSKEFLTVSTSQRLGNIRCSHCDSDPLDYSSDCIHYSGQVAELSSTSPLVVAGVHKAGKELKVFYGTDIVDYLEVSNVVVPAQPLSMIKSITEMMTGDSQLDDDKMKSYIDTFLTNAYSKEGNSMSDALLVDSSGMKLGILSDDALDDKHQETSGKTTIVVPRPADDDNSDPDQNTNLADNKSKDNHLDTVSDDVDNNPPNTEEEVMDKKDKEVLDLSADTVAILTEANVALKADNQVLNDKLAESAKAIEAAKLAVDSVSAKFAESQADFLITIRKTMDHNDVKDLDEDGLKAYSDKLKARSIESLQDSVADEKDSFSERVTEYSDSINNSVADGDIEDPTAEDDKKKPAVDSSVQDDEDDF